jgi:hypothetical protein
MQLVEFFLWRNLNTDYNIVLSTIGLILLILQPIFSLSIIEDVVLREWLCVLYVFWVLILGNLKVKKTVVDEGHLNWGFFKDFNLFVMGWIAFLFIGPIYRGLWPAVIIGAILAIITHFRYVQSSIRGSVWCWLVNIILLYYACILLLVLPFCF